MENLKKRCKKMIEALSLPKTRFCVKIGISTQAYNAWQRNELQLSARTTMRIDDFISKFGF